MYCAGRYSCSNLMIGIRWLSFIYSHVLEELKCHEGSRFSCSGDCSLIEKGFGRDRLGGVRN